MKEKHYFILKYRGGDIFDKMLETHDTGKAIESAIAEWNGLTVLIMQYGSNMYQDTQEQFKAVSTKTKTA